MAPCKLGLEDDSDSSKQPRGRALQTRQLDEGIALDAARKISTL